MFKSLAGYQESFRNLAYDAVVFLPSDNLFLFVQTELMMRLSVESTTELLQKLRKRRLLSIISCFSMRFNLKTKDLTISHFSLKVVPSVTTYYISICIS